MPFFAKKKENNPSEKKSPYPTQSTYPTQGGSYPTQPGGGYPTQPAPGGNYPVQPSAPTIPQESQMHGQQGLYATGAPPVQGYQTTGAPTGAPPPYSAVAPPGHQPGTQYPPNQYSQGQYPPGQYSQTAAPPPQGMYPQSQQAQGQYPQATPYQPAPIRPQQTVVVQGGFDAGARFGVGATPNIPPPPPGCAPNAAQMAAMQGQNVVMTQRPDNWLSGGSDGGYTIW